MEGLGHTSSVILDHLYQSFECSGVVCSYLMNSRYQLNQSCGRLQPGCFTVVLLSDESSEDLLFQ